MTPKFYAQVDKNQPAIVDALRGIGAEVQSLAPMGRGVPDIICAYKGKWFVAEIKGEGGKLNEKEQAWHNKFSRQAQVHVWYSTDDALKAIGAI